MSKAIQVKSSQNAFNATNAKDWLIKLVDNLNESNYHQLILIGNCETNLTKYIKKIQQGREFTDRELDEVTIRLIPFNVDYLQNTLENKLRKFFEHQGYIIQQQQIEILTHSILYSFLEFLITSEKVSRENFINILTNWAKNIFPKSVRKQDESELRIYLYDENIKELKMEDSSKKMSVESFQKMINQCNIEIEESFKVCKRQGFTTNLRKVGRFDWNDSFSTMKYSSILDSMSNPVVISDKVKDVEDQKEKYFAIHNLYRVFVRRNEISYFKHLVDSRNLVSLAIKKEGKIFDEEIEVTIEIAGEIDVLNRNDFPEIESYQFMEEIVGKRVLEKLLEIKSSQVINGYPYVVGRFSIIPNLKDIHPFSNEDRIDFENNTRLYKKCIQGYFDFEYHKDEEKKYLKFIFPKLNPNQIVAFPCRLYLLGHGTEMKVGYSIKSKYSSDVTVRNLTISTRK